LSRDYLLDSTKNRTLDVFDRSIDVQVSRLRRKIEAQGELIKTIRGAGYLFAAAVRRK
jgi:two-component system OmpR family response regulator